MEKMQDLKALLKHEIQDIYSAEEQIIEALPMMIENATNPKLKKALQQHLKITRQQVTRLDKVQQIMKVDDGEKGRGKKGGLLGLFGRGKTCKAMQGIIAEGNSIMAEDMNDEVKDAAIIAACQKVEHYEICSYGTVKAYAQQLGLKDVARLLDETLNEEYEADELLTELAVVEGVNEEAEISGAEARGGSRSQSQRSSGATARSASASRSAASPSGSGGGSSSGKASSSNGRTNTANNSRSNTSTKKGSNTASATSSKNKNSNSSSSKKKATAR